ncbi:hypothetical protein CK203_097096 [Vitis vinifera]|uniref:Uncharacterized protein n=1 Tax=Vitis vinifera TaxID=29760 RepID=A0A438FL86_VITVI|nr:hypothetical protein CK203_097096 [Vitis vinifera]
MGFVLNKWGGVGMRATHLEPAPLPSLLERQVHGLEPKVQTRQRPRQCKTYTDMVMGFSYFLDWQGGDIEKATDWIFSNPAAASSSDMDATASSTPTADAGLPDGGTSIYSDFLDKWYLLMVVACRMTEDSTGRVV